MQMKKSMSYRTLIKRTLLSISASAILLLPAIPALDLAFGHADSAGSYVTLSSFSGHPDVSLTVSGGGFDGSEAISIVASENGSTVASASTNAATGSFSTALNLPAKLTQGAVTITATGQTSGLTSSNSYYVTPFTPNLTTTSGQTTPYSIVSVSGTGYAPDETVDLNLAGATAKAMTNATGSFSDASITTPDVPAASYTIIGAGELSGASTVAYEYINAFYPSASPSSYYVMPNDSLGFNGSGFAPNETVNVTSATSGTQLSSFVTDKTGSFADAGAFVVPASYAGMSEKFVLSGTESDASTTVTTTVGKYYPNVSPTAYYLMPNKTLAFNGSGFVPGETVDVYSGTTLLEKVTADTKGNLTAAGPIVIPSTDAGTTQSYTLTGETSQGSGTVSVQIGNYNPQASPSGYYVMPGTVITFNGSGYAPDEVVTVFSGTNSVGSFNTDANGNFMSAGNIAVGYGEADSSVGYSLVGSVSNQPIDFKIGVGQLNTLLTPSSYYVLPYQDFSVSATGFAAGETVNLANGTTSLGTAVANDLGTATFSGVSLPYSGVSSATLTATGVTSRATATATVGIGNYNATVTSSNYYAKPGTIVTLTGTGFAPNENVDITAGTFTETVAADDMGNISAKLTLPFGQTKNSLTIVSTGEMSHATSSTTITLAPYMPSVSPSTYYAQPGTNVTFTGSGFVPGETIDVSLNGTQVGTERADSMGSLASTGTYSLPFGAKAAVYTVTGETSGGSVTMNIGLAQFYAGLSLSSYYGDGGSMINAIGSGFAPNELIRIQSGTNTLAKAAADSMGNFSLPIQVPYSAPGAISITAYGSMSGASPTTSYTVAQVYNSVTLGSYAVTAGQAVNILGSGFFAGEPVTVTTDRSSGSYTFDADGQGNLNDSGFVLPSNLAPGNLTLTITGTESFTTHTIIMYVQGPSA
jgi:hypothetical protein